MFHLDPITKRQLNRFRSLKRGYYAFWFLIIIIVFSLFAELFVSNRALLVSYEGELYFPTYGSIIKGKTFGIEGVEGEAEANYQQLKKRFHEQGSGNFVIMPIVPYNAFQIDIPPGSFEPGARPPDFARSHYLGTDVFGRDVLARILYGFRLAIFFSMAVLIGEWLIGISIGCLMGYLGGWFDSIVQRIVEVFQSVPFLYVIIIVSSIIRPNIYTLGGLIMIFGWMGMSATIRAVTYKEKGLDYVQSVRALGASHWRIIVHHIVPNMTAILVTAFPFALLGGITALTALDFLGFGLPAPAPSWGELLNQGTNNLQYPWIVYSVTGAIVAVLTTATFFGEAIREAFDPKQFTVYE